MLRAHLEEEMDPDFQDGLGNFEAAYSDSRWDASLYHPTVNHALRAEAPDFVDGIRWPDGKSFAACLTHDVDSVRIGGRKELLRTIASHLHHSRTIPEFIRHSMSLAGLRHPEQKLEMFTPWTEEERRRNFKSTFFVFPTRVSRRTPRDCTYRWEDLTCHRGEWITVREAIREVSKSGWEIGLHSSILSASDATLLREQKEDLESALGAPVYSVRQHNLRFDMRCTPQVQEAAGFQTDSTLGFNRDVGFRTGLAYPHRMVGVLDQRPLGLLEIPLVLHDGALLRSDNLDLGLKKAYEVCTLLIDRVAETRGVITLLWHPHTIGNPIWFELYVRLLDYIREKNGWGASVKQIHDWWIGQGLDAGLEAALKRVSTK